MFRFLCLIAFCGFFVNLDAQKKVLNIPPLYVEGSCGITIGGDGIFPLPLAALNISGGVSINKVIGIGLSISTWAQPKLCCGTNASGLGLQLRLSPKIAPVSFKFDYGPRLGASYADDGSYQYRYNSKKSDKSYFRGEISMRFRRIMVGAAYQTIGRQVNDNFDNSTNVYFSSTYFTPDAVSIFIGFSLPKYQKLRDEKN